MDQLVNLINDIDIDIKFTNEEELDLSGFNMNDPDEYDVLISFYQKRFDNLLDLSLNDQNKIIKTTINRYYRYIDGINNWKGIEYIYNDINLFINSSKNQVNNKTLFILMKRIDNDLFCIIEK